MKTNIALRKKSPSRLEQEHKTLRNYEAIGNQFQIETQNIKCSLQPRHYCISISIKVLRFPTLLKCFDSLPGELIAFGQAHILCYSWFPYNCGLWDKLSSYAQPKQNGPLCWLVPSLYVLSFCWSQLP